MEVLVSSGAFIGMANGRDHREFLRVADRLLSPAFEFMMYGVWYEKAEEILRDFLASGLPFPVFHMDKSIGSLLEREEGRKEAEIRFLRNCEYAAALGAKKAVLHLWNGPESDLSPEKHYEAYGAFAEAARQYGILLTAENVVCAYGDPLLHFRELKRRYPNVAFTFDTKMAAFHRENELVFSERYRDLWQDGSIAHIHMNDYGGTPGDFTSLRTLHLGEGVIDLPAFSASLKETGYDGTVTLECGSMGGDGTLSLAKMNRSRAYAERLLALP